MKPARVLLLLVLAVGAASAQQDYYLTPDDIPLAQNPLKLKIPAFPNNLVMFPNRDFITIEGYAKYADQELLLEVKRAGKVVGSAIGTVSGEEVAFEVNHPGGYCWGAGTGLKVTPDITVGDLVVLSVDFPAAKTTGEVVGESVIQDAFVESNADVGTGTFTITNHIGTGPNSDIGDLSAPLANKQWLEQRIIQPDWKDTAIGRRDARALPGPMTLAPRGGVTAGLDLATKTSTFVFNPEANRRFAMGGTSRLMAWQYQDVDGNRQGLTIAEFGESGGPGFGGCPLGPGDSGSPAGTFASLRSPDKTSVDVSWSDVAPVSPDAPSLFGFVVSAFAPATTNQRRTALGQRIEDKLARTATITGLDPAVASYDIEVRSLAFKPAVGTTPDGPLHASDPFGNTRPGSNLPAGNDAPTITATLLPNNKVTLEGAPEIYYTFGTTGDTGEAHVGDQPAPKADRYTAAFSVVAFAPEVTVKWIAYSANDAIQISERSFTLASTAPPPITTTLSNDSANSAGGQNRVTLKLLPFTDPDITGVMYNLYTEPSSPSGTPILFNSTTVTDTTSLRTAVFTGLATDASYLWTAAGVNSAGQPGPFFEPLAGPLKVLKPTDRITIAPGKWKSTDFRVEGTGSVVGATITLHAGNATHIGAPLIVRGSSPPVPVTTAVVAGVPAATWIVRLQKGASFAANPGTVWAKSDGGGVAGPVTISNARRLL